MKRIKITLKNYRCFSDEEPARFEIGPGFTAIVGPNNTGKSAAKLLFFELRHVFTFLGNPNVGAGVAHIFHQGWALGANVSGVTDVQEIFNNTNGRPLYIELELIELKPPGQIDQLTRIVMSCDRASLHWNFAAYGLRDPKRHLSYVNGKPTVRTPPAVIAHPAGDIDCSDFVEAANILGQNRYYGAFRNAINEGAGKYYDLVIGTSFVDLWSEWKTHGVKRNMELIDKVTEDIRRLFGFGKLEINASAQLKTLIVKIDGKSYRLAELGSGIAQFIMVFGNAAIDPPSILMIDEPETNLHPSLQQDFLLSLGSYTRHGVFFSTHSIGLARSLAQPIFSVQRDKGVVKVRPFEATPNYIEFVGELSFSAFKDLGHDRILLVEGVNDVRAAQQLLRLWHKDHTTVVLHLGGDQLACANRENELGELTRLSGNLYALVDSERSKANEEPIGNRKKFAEVCGKMGIKVCVTERRAIENYFSDSAVKAALGQRYAALTPFEELRSCANPWSKGENWRIVRNMKLDDLKGTDIHAFLDAL